MLGDYILFWAQHRERPVIIPGSFEDRLFLLSFAMHAVWYEIAKKLLGDFVAQLTEIFIAEGKEGLDQYFEKMKNGKTNSL